MLDALPAKTVTPLIFAHHAEDWVDPRRHLLTAQLQRCCPRNTCEVDLAAALGIPHLVPAQQHAASGWLAQRAEHAPSRLRIRSAPSTKCHHALPPIARPHLGLAACIHQCGSCAKAAKCRAEARCPWSSNAAGADPQKPGSWKTFGRHVRGFRVCSPAESCSKSEHNTRAER